MNTTTPSKAYYKNRDTLKRATSIIVKHSDIEQELKEKLLYLLDKELISWREALNKVL